MEQEQKDIQTEQELLLWTTNEVTTKAVSEPPKISQLADQNICDCRAEFSGAYN